MERLALVVVDPAKAMLIKIGGYVPVVFGVLAILIVGWLIAKLIEAVVVRVLKAVRLDMASDKAGVTNILAQGDVKATLSEILGAVVYWLIILVVIVTALNALNLTVAASLLSRLVSYVPNIIAAIFVLVLGSFLAGFVGTLIRTAASNAGIQNAKGLGRAAQIVLVIFTAVIAIEQLGIATALIALSVNVILASLGLGIALAFGLGCKDIAGKFIADLVNSLKK